MNGSLPATANALDLNESASECPRSRFIKDVYGNPGKNYLCEGYRMFFRHIAPYMDFMKKEYMNQRPPSNVMQHIQEIEDSRK